MSVRKAKVSNHDTGFSIKAKPFFEIFSHARVYVRGDQPFIRWFGGEA